MADFSGGPANFTPSLTNDNWTLDVAASTTFDKVISFSWGGSATTSIGYRTRWVRPTAKGTGAGTPLVLGTSDVTVPLASLYSTYATTQPTLPGESAGNLHFQNWNAQGGNGYIILPYDSQWLLVAGILQGSLSCRNTAGVDAGLSSYQVNFKEGS